MRTESDTELKKFLRECVKVTNKELDVLLPACTVEPVRLHEAVRHSVFAGGKRIRPALVYAVGMAFGSSMDRLKTVASAIEMIHTYSLIHDDLPSMDDDDLRRGRPTCHIEFGEATAILAGDVLQTIAFGSIAADKKLDEEVRLLLISELSLAAGTPVGMIAGQQMDLDGEGKDFTIEELELIHQSKTGAMITVSAKAGAIVGSSSDEELASVERFGSKLGLLFQITDDLLDVTQSTEVLGKTAGKDVSVEKATYPAFYGIERTRQLAGEAHRDACAELDLIENSDLLRSIADYTLNRNS